MKCNLLAALLLCACDNVLPADHTAKINPPISKFVEGFAANHTDWLKNEIIEERTNNIFKDSLVAFYKRDSALSGLKLKLRETSKTDDGQYVAYFVSSEILYLNDRRMNFEVATLIAPKLIDSLISESQYSLEGKFLAIIDDDIYNYNLATAGNTDINFSAYKDSTYYLGLPLFKAERITPVQ